MDQFLPSLMRQPLEDQHEGRQVGPQLELVLRVLEEERKRQEEIRKTKELELEILRLRDSIQKADVCGSGAGHTPTSSDPIPPPPIKDPSPVSQAELPVTLTNLVNFQFPVQFSAPPSTWAQPTPVPISSSFVDYTNFLHDLQTPMPLDELFQSPEFASSAAFDSPPLSENMGQFSPAQGLPAEFRYDETLQAGLPAYQNIEDFFTDQWNPLPLAENTAGLPTPPTPQYVRASSPNVSILPPYHLPSPPLPSQILHTGTNTQQHLPPSTLSTPTARPMTSQGPNSLTFSIIPQPDQRSAQHDSSTQQRRSSAKFAPARPSTPNKSTRDTSGRKKIIDHTVHCKRCKNEIATFLLHPESKNVPPLNFAVDILCVSCEGRKDSLEVDDTSMVLAGRRKRLHDDYGMDCEICKRRIGSGGFKFSEERELQAIGVGGKVRDEDGAMVEEAMDFRVEPICASCRVKYKFCTECGGGGKFRTGKYRPVELFASNRRTCLLSHVRLGGAPVTYEVYLTPTNVCESLYNESREVHMDGFYGLYATPEVIEAAITQLESYAKVEEWANKGWRSAERLLREDVEKTRGLRRYLAVVYVEKPQSRVRGATIKRIKANAKNPHSTGPGLPPPQTTPSSTSTPSASPSFESSSPSGTATTPDHDSPRIQVAYGSAEWDISTGTVLFANGYVRTTTVSTLPILRGMHERLLRQCLTDSATVQAPVPVKHVWMLARRDHLRVQSYVERMGFKPLDEYVRMNPGVDKSLFEREVHVPRDLFRCFVCSVHEFLREGERERNGGVGGCGIGGGYRGVWR